MRDFLRAFIRPIFLHGIIKALRPWIVLTKHKTAARYYATTLRIHPQLLYSVQSQNIGTRVPVKGAALN